MQKSRIAVIGGGIAGMEAAGQLVSMGFNVTLLEKDNILGGHVNDWHHLFPDGRPAQEIILHLKQAIQNDVEIQFGAEVHKFENAGKSFKINLTDGQNIESEAVIIATGYDVFDARKKEEYGYGIYPNVITSADLEAMLKSGKPIKTAMGKEPNRVAFIHCVGSRDEKAGNSYCSKVCCVTAVKQAIEVKKLYPSAEIYSFYMDLRMFDRYFEDIYYQAQSKYGIRFIRGRLSEACEGTEGTVILKAEDTLSGKPIKMSADMVVLMSGIVSSKGTAQIAERTGISTGADKFIDTSDKHLCLNISNRLGVFVAGTCTGPKSVAETLNDARSAAIQAANYLRKNFN